MTDNDTDNQTDKGMYKPCQDCGYPFAQPAGACHVCPECGSTTGCS